MPNETGPNGTRPMSRRQLIRVSVAGAFGSAAAACSTLGLPRIAKVSAGYEDRSKNDKHCAGCEHFQAPNGCTVVEGVISPRGLCRYYLPKA